MASPEYQRSRRLMMHEADARISPLNAAIASAVPTVILPGGAVNIYARERNIELQEVVYRAGLDEMDFAFDRLRDHLIAEGRTVGGIVFRSTPQATVDSATQKVIVWTLCWFHPFHVIYELRAQTGPWNRTLFPVPFLESVRLRYRPTPVDVWSS